MTRELLSPSMQRGPSTTPAADFRRRAWPRGAAHPVLGLALAVSLGACVAGSSGAPGVGDPAIGVGVEALTWTETTQLIASDGAMDDWAGSAVAASGDTVVVGAPYHQAYQGAAYVFVKVGSKWVQQAELTVGGSGSEITMYGAAVSVDGDVAVVGSPGDPFSGPAPGVAYVFERSGGQWTQTAALQASDAGPQDQLGASVSVSGGMVVVGAPGRQVGSNAQAGAAYVFARSGSTWSQQAEIGPSDGVAGDTFGAAVSLSGSTAIIGAPSSPVMLDSSVGNGAAYVFSQSGAAWVQQAKFHAFDGTEGDAFGAAVSLDGDTAIVGAPNHRISEFVQSGGAYFFAESGSTWSQQAEIGPSDGMTSDAFGTSVSLSGGTALIGAPQMNRISPSVPGAAYVFTESGTTWSQEDELSPSDGAPGDWFGTAVALSGSTVIVGASRHAVLGGTGVGVAYVYDTSVGPIDGGAGDAGTGGSNGDGSNGGSTTSTGEDTGPAAGGCGCTVAPESPLPLGSTLLVPLLALALARGRRRALGVAS
jgi:MYXO-CTERM domain-containing protein